MKRTLLAASAAGLLGATTAALAQPYGGVGLEMMGGGGGWGWFGVVHMVLWWFLIILGIVVLAKWLFGGSGGRATSEDRALAILRERYARGEIDKREFDARRSDLGG